MRGLRSPMWSTKTQMCHCVLEREVIETSTKLSNVDKVVERRHLEEEALLDRRRLDLESATVPIVPKTMNRPDAPIESDRTAHEITHLPPTPWCETCALVHGIESPHVRLTPLEHDESPSLLWTLQ